MGLRLAFYLVVLITIVGSIETGVSARAGKSRGEGKPRKVTARCHHAIENQVDPNWRSRSTTAWQFGLYGPNRDFRDERRSPGSPLRAKIPAIIEGPKSFVLRVPRSQRGKVGLHYGPTFAARIKDAATQVTFKPCRGKTRTGWPGGLLLKNRDPVKLRVRRESGQVATIRIGRLP